MSDLWKVKPLMLQVLKSPQGSEAMDTPMVLIPDSGEDGDFKDGGGHDEDDQKKPWTQ